MIFIIFTVVATGVCISLYGWGLLLHQLTKCPSRNWAVTVTVGLSVIIFWGGVFNLLRFAYGWTLDGILIAGIVLAAKYHKFKPNLLRKNRSEWSHIAILGLLIVIIMNFTVRTQLPPKAFNWHDDFEKYFAHPVRMLHTGTLFGSPLSALGSETLGGQAVLHGTILNHFPFPYINGADAVFGLFLCLLLPISMIPPHAMFLPIAVVSLLMVFFINPQYANISALYTGSVFMMASIMLVCDSSEHKNNTTQNLPSPVLLGLIYAALIALKSIFIVFPLLHVSFFIIALIATGVAIRRLVRWSTFTAISTFLFLLPWVLLYLPHYVRASYSEKSQSTIITASSGLNLLSSQPLSYGASFAHYTFIGIAIAILILGIVLWKRKKLANSSDIIPAGLTASGSTIIAAYLLIMVIAPRLNGYVEGIRYTIPFLIAGAPVTLTLVYLWAIRNKSFRLKLSFSMASLFLGIIILISFSESLTKRIQQGYAGGSILAFSNLATHREYIKYCNEVLHGDTRLQIITAQKQIPGGQAVVVWVSTPFYLDYKCNFIFDAEPAGIASPWAHIPEADYFLVEYSGFAVRSLDTYLKNSQHPGRHERYVAERCIAFLQSLGTLKQNADEIYNDGKIVIFKKHKN